MEKSVWVQVPFFTPKDTRSFRFCGRSGIFLYLPALKGQTDFLKFIRKYLTACRFEKDRFSLCGRLFVIEEIVCVQSKSIGVYFSQRRFGRCAGTIFFFKDPWTNDLHGSFCVKREIMLRDRSEV